MKAKRDFRNPGRPEWYMRLLAAVIRVIRQLPRLERKFKNFAQLLDYQAWVEELPGTSHFLGSRQLVWAEVGKCLHEGERIRVLEFGVAWGYLTKWWFDKLDDVIAAWEGFDRFTGLPRPWRSLEIGAFDAGGSPPALDDERLVWHVGDVEDTLEASLRVSPLDGEERVLFIFDLDLFEPSLHCWNAIRPYLKSGDFLYFDEAFDRDERVLIVSHVLASGIQMETVAHSTTCLLLRIC